MKLSAVWIIWHRRIGLALAPILIVLAITGVLINHSQSLGWHHKPIYSGVLAWLYGIPVSSVNTGYKVSGVSPNDWLYQLVDDIYLGERLLVSCSEPLGGVVSRTEEMVILCGKQLIFLTMEGELIEELLPSEHSIKMIGLNQHRLIGKGDEGTFLFDERQFDWSPLSEPLSKSVNWSEAEALPSTLQKSVNSRNPVAGLNRERVLLDLHSGRLFGAAGVWVVDASGVVLVFLALSGTITWLTRAMRRRKR